MKSEKKKLRAQNKALQKQQDRNDAIDLSTQRSILKLNIYNTRKGQNIFFGSTCALCGFPFEISGYPDMHEVFFTRGDVQGLPAELQSAIMVRENCVLLCQKCHLKAMRSDVKVLLAKHLIRYENIENVINFVNSFSDYVPQSMIAERLNLISKAQENLNVTV
jgi:5-methylcytosine-specific restriction endonuclease McrA